MISTPDMASPNATSTPLDASISRAACSLIYRTSAIKRWEMVPNGRIAGCGVARAKQVPDSDVSVVRAVGNAADLSATGGSCRCILALTSRTLSRQRTGQANRARRRCEATISRARHQSELCRLADDGVLYDRSAFRFRKTRGSARESVALAPRRRTADSHDTRDRCDLSRGRFGGASVEASANGQDAVL